MLISTNTVKPFRRYHTAETMRLAGEQTRAQCYSRNGKPICPKEAAMSFLHDLKIALRSLARARALWITVALTLALGIGANAAIFSVVRAVLLRPLANRDEDQLLYLRQSSPGIGQDNAAFSVPEIQDIGSGLKSIKELGTFSEIDFTVVGLGTPREIPAGVVDGRYFEVMGLHPVLGRL